MPSTSWVRCIHWQFAEPTRARVSVRRNQTRRADEAGTELSWPPVSRDDWWTADAITRRAIRRELLDGVRARLHESPLDIEAVTAALLHVATTLGFIGVGLWFLTEEGTLRNGSFAAVAEMPLFKEQSLELEFRPGEGMPGRTFLHGVPEWIPNVIRDDNFPRIRGAIRDLVRTVVGFPAFEDGRPVGVVEMFSRDERDRDVDMIDLFTALGEQLGGFMASRSVDD